GDEEIVDLCVDLPRAQAIGRRLRRAAATAAIPEAAPAALPRAFRIAIGVVVVPASDCQVRRACRFRFEVHWHERRLADEDDRTLYFVLDAVEVLGQFGLCRPKPLRSASAAARALGLRNFGTLRCDQVERGRGDRAFRTRCPRERL